MQLPQECGFYASPEALKSKIFTVFHKASSFNSSLLCGAQAREANPLDFTRITFM
jgi:hypothetical protein